MNEFTQILTLENAQVIWQEKELSRANENVNHFMHFVNWDNIFIHYTSPGSNQHILRRRHIFHYLMMLMIF